MSTRLLTPERDAGRAYLPAAKPLAWASAWRYLPVSSGELAAIIGWYPVGFQATTAGYRLAMPARSPSDEPALINELTGRFVGRRAPMVLRSYPYRLVAREGGDGSETTALGIETEAEPQWQANARDPVYDDAGEPTALYEQRLTVLRRYYRRRQQDQALIDKLAALKLLKPWPLDMGKEGAENPLDDFFQLDEPALNQLAPLQLGELLAGGGGRLIYGHLFSRARAQAPANILTRTEKLQAQYEAVDALDYAEDETLRFAFD